VLSGSSKVIGKKKPVVLSAGYKRKKPTLQLFTENWWDSSAKLFG